MQLTMLIIYASLAIGVSFLCSLLEAVLLSMSHSHVSILEKSGSKSGAIWSNLKNDDAVKPLTAILTLNTIAHTMGAAGVGAEVQSVWDESWLTLASIILTIAVLIFSEIIPKTLGSVYWKQLATPSGWVLYYLTKFLSPLFIPILWAKKRLPQPPKNIVTRDELAVLADIGEEEGTLEEDEETVIHNLLKLRDVPVMDIMTPRVVTTAFDENWTVQQV
ncbi:MAG: CNNM domain-containing protein, partial [Candidatus Poseidoniales archaeon]